MDSNPNREKRMRSEESVDRISGLPDKILGKILSHISTKEAVATSVLSKRWEYAWISVSKLHFDDQFCDTNLSFDKNDGDVIDPNRFRAFVDRVFLFCDSLLLKQFSVNVSRIRNVPYVSHWISTAVWKYSIRKMNITIDVDDKFDLLKSSSYVVELPKKMFWKTNLVSLELKCRNVIVRFPTSFRLANLRYLHISVFNPCLDFTQHLFSSCPELEKLNISIHLRFSSNDIEDYEKERSLVLSTDSLMELEVSWTTELPEIYRHLDHRHKVILDCPKLFYIDVHDEYVAYYEGWCSSEIIVAKVDMGVGCICSRKEDRVDATLLRRVLKFFHCITSVETLWLSHPTVSVLYFLDETTMPRFHNLKKMEMCYSTCVKLELFVSLLGYAPNLEHLILHKIRWHTSLPGKTWCGLPKSTPCLINSLETIQIFGLEGKWEDLIFVCYLIKNAKVLKSLKLSTLVRSSMYVMNNNLASEKELEFRNEVLGIGKASKNCEIEFDGDF